MGHNLNNYKRIGVANHIIYLPDNSLFDEETLRNIRASILASFIGVTVKTALKYVKEADNLVQEPNAFAFIDECRKYCVSIVSSLETVLPDLPLKENLRHGIIWHTFARLPASFEAAIFLSYEGFNYETKAILRLILENLSLIYQVVQTPMDHEEISMVDFHKKYRISSTNVKAIKRFYSNADLGKLYGLLSDYIHFDWKTHNSMFSWGQEKMGIYLKSHTFIYENYLILIMLLELTQDILLDEFKNVLESSDIIDENLLHSTNNNGLRFPKSQELIDFIRQQEHIIKDSNYDLLSIFRIRE